MNRKRVFIVDDHALVREGLAKLIEQEPDLKVCAEAENAAQAYQGVVREAPDIVIVDLSLGEESGLDLIKRIRALPRPPAVLVLSMHDEAIYAERALRAGADGYVMKRESTGRVVAALREVLEGHIYLSESIAAWVAGRLIAMRGGSERSLVDRLSDRELEIFRRIGQGQENREIAEALRVSLKTVQTHCAHIKEKLDLPNATVLIREAVRWVESPAGRPAASDRA